MEIFSVGWKEGEVIGFYLPGETVIWLSLLIGDLKKLPFTEKPYDLTHQTVINQIKINR